MWNVFVVIYAIWNIAVFILYGVDKFKAQAGAWRVSEKTLLLCALCFGAIGAFAGMKVFRHKTKHAQFTILVPIMIVLNLLVIGFIGAFPEIMAELF